MVSGPLNQIDSQAWARPASHRALLHFAKDGAFKISLSQKQMRKPPISEVLIDATRLLESGECSYEEQRAICETIRTLIGHETVSCHTRMQRELLVAKAWSIATGGMSKHGRGFGARDRSSWDRIRAIFAELRLDD